MYELWLFLIVIAVLFTCLAGSIDSLIIFCIALFIAVALLGFIMPIGTQLALMFQHKNTGAASALLSSLQFGFDAIITAIIGASFSASGFGLVSILLLVR